MMTDILIIFILILLNGFFALSEISIVSSSKPILRQLAKQGNGRAQKVLALADDPGYFLSAVQIGITLVGIFAGAYGGATIAEQLAPSFVNLPYIGGRAETISMIVVVGAITYLSVVVGELIPKKIGLLHAEKIALVVVGPMAVISKIAHPVVSLLSISSKVLMKFMGIVHEKNDAVSEDELKAVLSDGAESGIIEKTEHEMLQRVIRLDDRDVKSIMTHRKEMAYLTLENTLDVVRMKIHQSGHSRYPVINPETEEVIGVVHAKDLLDRVLQQDAFDMKPLLKPIMVVPEGASCLRALDSLKTKGINLLVVVDEYGTTQGIVTPADILEAIVGVLPSNYDHGDEMAIVERADGSWLVDGRTPIEEIHLSIGLHEISADEDYDTIAGYLLHEMRKSPAVGVVYESLGYRFEIVDMDGLRIDKVLMSKISTVS